MSQKTRVNKFTSRSKFQLFYIFMFNQFSITDYAMRKRVWISSVALLTIHMRHWVMI
jgi:hypothetical protein